MAEILRVLAPQPASRRRDEISFHMAMRVNDLTARGMTRERAQRQAEREFGDARVVQQQVERIDTRMIRREARAEWWGELTRDVRVGLCSLRNSPAFTVTAVLCAALGIGVTAAIVSAANSILLRPLPFRDADQLVSMMAENTERGYTRTNISWPDFASWRDESRLCRHRDVDLDHHHAVRPRCRSRARRGGERLGERLRPSWRAASARAPLAVIPARRAARVDPIIAMRAE